MLYLQTRFLDGKGNIIGAPSYHEMALNMESAEVEFLLDRFWEGMVVAGEARRKEHHKFTHSIICVQRKRDNEHDMLGMQDTIDVQGVHLVLWRKIYVDWLYALRTDRRGTTHVRSGLPLDTPVATLGHGPWRPIAGIDSLTMTTARGDPVPIDLSANPGMTLRDLARLFDIPNSSDEVSIPVQFA